MRTVEPPPPVVAWRDRTLAEPVHGRRSASILGIALGVSFTLCFLTGVWSHLAQHPVSWFDWPAQPSWGYRLTQGTHVASGIAAIPLLLAKLWTVYPHLFAPVVLRPAHLVERVSLVPLVAGSLFMLFSGWANVARWYPWEFFFPRAHYWVAWITFGALVVHVGAKITTVRQALAAPPDTGAPAAGAPADAAEPDAVAASAERSDPTRRNVLRWAFGTSAALSAVTIGQTWPWFRSTVLFAPRRNDTSIQGVPVNQTAAEAGVVESANAADFRLVVEVDGEERTSLGLADLEALERHTADLAIACVEGWSAAATWSGVRVRDLLAAAGAPTDRDVLVRSLEQGGLYSSSTLVPGVAQHGDTLLALEINGERLDIDHGYPVRLIAPNRPGVLQTKWVTRLVVL